MAIKGLPPTKGSMMMIVLHWRDEITIFNPDKIETMRSRGMDTVITMDSGDHITVYGYTPREVCEWIAEDRHEFNRMKKEAKKK